MTIATDNVGNRRQMYIINCMKVPKQLQLVQKNEKLLLWCAQVTRWCWGWTSSFENFISDLRNAPKRLRKTVIQRRRLFAGFAAARRTMMQNWCAPHVCGEAYWIAYYYFFYNIRDYIKQGWGTLILEGRCPAEFSSNPNQTHLNQLIKVWRMQLGIFSQGFSGFSGEWPSRINVPHPWYKGRTCFVVTFSLPLSLPFDWTFKIWSMCLLLCFVCFEWMLCCDVVCENKKNKMLITKKIIHNNCTRLICMKQPAASLKHLKENATAFPYSNMFFPRLRRVDMYLSRLSPCT